MSEWLKEGIDDFIVLCGPTILSVLLLFPHRLSPLSLFHFLSNPAVSSSLRVPSLLSPLFPFPLYLLLSSTLLFPSSPYHLPSSSLPQYLCLHLQSIFLLHACLSCHCVPSPGFSSTPFCAPLYPQHPFAKLTGLTCPNPLPCLLMSRGAFEVAKAGAGVGP